MEKARGQRGAFPLVPLVEDDSQIGGGAKRVQNGAGPVGAAVVNQDDFARNAAGPHPVDNFPDRTDFVIDGNDHREEKIGRQAIKTKFAAGVGAQEPFQQRAAAVFGLGRGKFLDRLELPGQTHEFLSPQVDIHYTEP